MDSAQNLRLVSLGLWLLFGLLSYSFSETGGLAYSIGPSELAYVRELESSGSDDGIGIEMGVLCAGAALIWGAFRFRSRFGFADLLLQGVLLTVQAAYLAAIEVGSVFDTVVRDRNVVLALWLVVYFALWSCWLIGLGLTHRGRSAHGSALKRS